MTTRAGSKHLIREINEAFVLDTVRTEGTTSRSRISAVTGLSPATVTGIAAKLLSSGHLVETTSLRGTGGRPAQLLMLGTERVFSIGVRLSPSAAFAVLTDLRGQARATRRIATRGTDPAHAVTAIAEAIDDLESQLEPDQTIVGVGVSLSGIVDAREGTVVHSGALGWEAVRLRELLGAHTMLPVSVDNFVNALALGLVLYGSPRETQNAVVVHVGSSIGMSFVISGRIYRGARGTAGGLAHSRIGTPGNTGRPCHCGKDGCLETWSSMWGLDAELERRGHHLPVAQLQRHWDVPDVRDVVELGADALATSLANASRQFGPDTLIVSLAPELRFAAFETELRSRFAAEFRLERVEPPPLSIVTADESSAARGAACQALADLFQAKEHPKVFAIKDVEAV